MQPLSNDLPESHVEVQVPLALGTKWVAFACRQAGVGKPKWHPAHDCWTTSAVGEDGVTERVTIAPLGERGVRVTVGWHPGAPRHSATARRIVTSLVTSMQWAVRRRTADESGTYAVSRLR